MYISSVKLLASMLATSWYIVSDKSIQVEIPVADVCMSTQTAA